MCHGLQSQEETEEINVTCKEGPEHVTPWIFFAPWDSWHWASAAHMFHRFTCTHIIHLLGLRPAAPHISSIHIIHPYHPSIIISSIHIIHLLGLRPAAPHILQSNSSHTSVVHCLVPPMQGEQG